MKKSILLVIILSVLLTFAFGANLKVWTVYKDQSSAYQALAEDIKIFEEETGTTVELVSVPDQTDMNQKMQLSAPAGMGPDLIATMPHDIIGKWAHQGLLMNLDEYESDLEPFFQSTLQAVTYQGHTYGFPLSVESVALVYNKDLVPEAPETFDDVVRIIKEMQENDMYGLVFPAAEPYHMYGIISGFGGYIFDWKNNEYDIENIGMNNEGAFVAINYLKSFFDYGYFPEAMMDRSTQHGFSTGTFEEGQAALQINGPWVTANLENLGINYGVSVIPQLPGGSYPKPFLGVQFVGINNFTKNKEEAVELAKYLTNMENMKDFALKTQLTPTREDVLNSEEIQSNEMISAWAEQASLGSPMPNIPEMSNVWSAWSDALQIIYSDKEPTRDVLDELELMIKEKIEMMNQ